MAAVVRLHMDFSRLASEKLLNQKLWKRKFRKVERCVPCTGNNATAIKYF